MARRQLWKRRKPVEEGAGTAAAPREEPARAASATGGTGTSTLEAEPEPEKTDAESESHRREKVRRLSIRHAVPVLLAQAAHPRQALLTAFAVGAAAAIAGRPTREAGAVLLTVLVGQTILGWHNDLVDRHRDARHQTPGKPVASGRLDPGTVWFALTVGVLLVVPLSISTGITAGVAYILSLLVAMLGNVVLRRGRLSWVPWAVSFALYPAYLSYGGWGGSAEGDPPSLALTVLAGLLGVGVHVLRAIWGLVADNEDGWTYLPLKLGLRLGATKLLVFASVYTAAVLAAIAVVGTTSGLTR